MDWKKFAADYLSFSRRDRIAIISLLIIMGGVYFLPRVVKKEAGPASRLDSLVRDGLTRNSIKKKEQKKEENGSGSYSYSRPAYQRKTAARLFDFDPNTASAGELKTLGLRDKTIGIIQRYLAKGGRFRVKEDLLKIYGLFPDEYERLAPFIKIKEEPTPGRQDKKAGPVFELFTGPGPAVKSYSTININTADSTEWSSLPGIGSKLSNRIINFRNKLGGFYSVQQVAETFGLTDSVFQKIRPFLKVDPGTIHRININTASIEELRVHPYLKYATANAIISYRNEHGRFNAVEDIKNILSLTDEVYKKIYAYLVID